MRRLGPIVWIWLMACGPGDGSQFATVTLELRPDTPGTEELFRFEPNEDIERYASDRVVVHFTRQGPNAVPQDDVDGDGIPDYVQVVSDIYEESLTSYEQRGFRSPLSDHDLADDNGGDGRFDVYLIDFFGSSDGSFQTDRCTNVCIGYAVQENDFAGYGYPNLRVATRILATHELFHAVQASYDAGQDIIFREGTAVWATEALAPELNDFEAFIRSFLQRPDRSLNRPARGVVGDTFAYGSALFFQFVSEKFDDADVVRRLLERVEDGSSGVEDPVWYEALDDLLESDFNVGLSEAFVEFALWNAFTGPHAGKLEGVGYAGADRYPPVTVQGVELPYVDARDRIPQLSSQYFQFVPPQDGGVEVRLVGDAEDLALWLILEGPDGTQVARGSTRAMASMEGSHRGLTILVNPRLDGPSRRPDVCVGTPAFVQSCAEDFEIPDPETDPESEESPEPEPLPQEPDEPEEQASEAGGCQTGGTGNPLGVVALLWAAARAAARRRARPADEAPRLKLRRPSPNQ